jgi:hypothetical protein
MSVASPIKPNSMEASISRSLPKTYGIRSSGTCDHLGATRTKRTRQSSDALLAGKLFEEGGNRMSPTLARKVSKRWRYYVSQATLQGDKGNAGSIVRVPPANVEALVVNAVSKLSSTSAASQTDIRGLIDRLVIGRASIQIQLSEVAEAHAGARTFTLPWTRPSPYCKQDGPDTEVRSRRALP